MYEEAMRDIAGEFDCECVDDLTTTERHIASVLEDHGFLEVVTERMEDRTGLGFDWQEYRVSG